MLYLLFLYAGISFICLLAGILFFEWSFSPKNDTDNSDKPFVVYTITGLIVLTGIAQWLALLMPLTGAVNAVIISVPVIIGIILRKRVSAKLLRTWHSLKTQWPVALICFCCFLLMILTINAGPVHMDDTESYHIQMVKWLREYGTVPGLANLHVRFGFNSSWFSSVGLLTPQTTAINSYLVLNGLISTWFCQYLLEKLQQVYTRSENRMRFNLIAGIFFVVVASITAWPLIRGNATNMNYDFITTLCLFILFLEAIVADKLRFGWEWVVWPCFLFTVRVVNYPVLFLTLYVFILNFTKRRLKQAFSYMLVSLLLIAPFIVRNVVLSGYLFYPAYQVDIFSVDWKAGRQMTKSKQDFIKYFNRVNTMYKPLLETKTISFPYWVPEWFRFLFPTEKPVVVAGLGGFAAGLVFFRRLRKRISNAAIVFVTLMMVQLVSWFFVAPDPRFAFGPLLCGVFLLAMVLPPLNLGKNGKIILTAAVWLLSAGVLTYTARKLIYSAEHKNFIVPFALPQPGVDTVMIDGIRLYIPQKINNNWNRRCYDTHLPCLYRVHPGLRARGKELSDGFYIQPGTDTLGPGVWY